MHAVADRVFETSMSELTEREELVESSGYRYHFVLMHYVNRTARRVFSIEFVESHSREELQRLIIEAPTTTGWVFYFNEQPSDGMKRKLIEEYEK